jgi:DNA-binding NtrC family response regulator/tetratricopeptide (TPR) repeat protein/class 3 adenylate cyclase
MAHPRPLPPSHPTDRILGNTPPVQALRAQIRHLAAFDSIGNPSVPTVLLCGETGTGKGLVARVIHDSGPRAQRPFLEVNCAAIPETLLEAELFGFEAGAFTDAKRHKPGLFEEASGGTLFLDEIDALPLALQGKLLTAIEAKRVRRVGATRDRQLDVKLIAATPAALSACVAEGRFRADLYHRLAVVVLELPPLRERREDIIVLAQRFLEQYAEAHRLGPKRLSGAAEAWLLDYPWPGNVRELSHLMERLTLLTSEAIVNPHTLERLCLPRIQPAVHAETSSAKGDDTPQDEAALIAQALLHTKGNVVHAARLLGWSRKALRYRMQRYGIERPSGEARTAASPSSSLPAGEGQAFAPSPRRGEGRGEGASTSQDERRAAPLSGAPQTPIPSWEQKPVAVLAIEVTWPAAFERDAPRYEPWTLTAQCEQRLLEKVQGFGGVVIQQGPSLLLVAFGLPHTLEQLPQRAVQAALALRHLVTEAPAAASRPELRLVVHWGQLLVDPQACDPAARLLPIGDTLALPVRLLGQAAPGEILVSPEVGRLVEGWFALQACKSHRGEGKPGRMVAYTVMGVKPRPSPLAMHGERPLSQFVGRQRELAILEDLQTQVERGRGQVVGMVGEPGVGKSRLCYEFTRGPWTQRWLILETSADPYGKVTPYLPVIDLLKTYFQIAERDDVPTIRTRVSDNLLGLDQALGPTLPAILALLDVPVEDPAWQALDPPQRRQRILEALTWLLLRESQVQPLLLVVENLHWIDTETQAFLDGLIEGLPAARIFLLASYRPEYQHAWGSKTYYTQLRLDPLPCEHAKALLTSLLGNNASLEPLMQRLIEQTEGNPFFLEEIVQALVEQGALVPAGAVGETGRSPLLTIPLTDIPIPPTVQAVLAARIDRLPSEAKCLLQTAAVIGKDAPVHILQAIADLPEESLHQGLAGLQAAEFLYETSLFPEREYTFKHALTHEVAYESLLPERRGFLHARIVDAIETLYADKLAEHIEQLAYHALTGEAWEKAVAYLRQAGAKASAHSANREAVAYFEQALAALQHLPESRDTREQAIDLRLNLRNSLFLLGELARILEHLREAETLAVALNDQRRLGQIAIYMMQHCRQIGDYDRAIASGQRALALAGALENLGLQVAANVNLGQAYHALGDYRRGVDILRRTVESLTEDLNWERFGMSGLRSVGSRTFLVWCLAEMGEFAEGIAIAAEAVRIAEAADDPFPLIQAHMTIGYLYLRQGNFRRAIPALERGVDICQVKHIPLLFRELALLLGSAYALSGRVTEALPLLEQAVEQASAMKLKTWQSLRISALSEAYLLTGRREEARQLAARALELSREYKEQGHQAWALRLLGEIAAHRDPPDAEQAAASYQQALALAEERGMRPLLAHCHLGLGTLYRRMGRLAQARAELSAASELFRAMEMTFWLPQAEAELAQAE